MKMNKQNHEQLIENFLLTLRQVQVDKLNLVE